jgi:hypothetical protein
MSDLHGLTLSRRFLHSDCVPPAAHEGPLKDLKNKLRCLEGLPRSGGAWKVARILLDSYAVAIR